MNLAFAGEYEMVDVVSRKAGMIGFVREEWYGWYSLTKFFIPCFLQVSEIIAILKSEVQKF